MCTSTSSFLKDPRRVLQVGLRKVVPKEEEGEKKRWRIGKQYKSPSKWETAARDVSALKLGVPILGESRATATTQNRSQSRNKTSGTALLGIALRPIHRRGLRDLVPSDQASSKQPGRGAGCRLLFPPFAHRPLLYAEDSPVEDCR